MSDALPSAPFADVAWDDDPDWDWNSAAEDSADDLLDVCSEAVERSRAVVTALVLAGLSLVGCASQPAAPASPSTSPSTTGPAAAATITAETFAHSGNHYLRNAADDVWCGVVTEPDGTAVVGCQVGFPIHDVPCTRGMPIYEFRAGVESDAQCTDDALFINPNAESVVLSDGQSVTIGTTTFTGERGGITLSGAPLEGGLHLSRLVGAQFAG